MTVPRKTIRQNLSTLLQTSVLPGTTQKCFASVYEGPPDEVMDDDMPACVIMIGDSDERRLTDPVGAGSKSLSFFISLEIFSWVDASDDLLGERHLEDILDGVDNTLRVNTTITGSVVLAYDIVRTTFHRPVVANDGGGPAGKILLHATRQISALAYDGG